MGPGRARDESLPPPKLERAQAPCWFDNLRAQAL
jgi:hypothetical protein